MIFNNDDNTHLYNYNPDKGQVLNGVNISSSFAVTENHSFK